MSGRRKGGGKAKIEMSKPELPPFLQRMREQIVANEDADRKAQSVKKRKERGERPEEDDEGPTIVKVGDDDLTEEEYKRMKLALETQYKLDSELKKAGDKEELDVDKLLERRQTSSGRPESSTGRTAAAKGGAKDDEPRGSPQGKRHKLTGADEKKKADSNKKLSYDDDEDEDSDE